MVQDKNFVISQKLKERNGKNRIAYNNTYGKGLNPELYEDVVDWLEVCVEIIKESFPEAKECIKQSLEALKKSRI